MVARFDADESLWIGEGFDESFKLSGRAKLVARSADEKFWLGTRAQELEIINAAFNLDRGQAECYERSNTVVGKRGPQSDSRAERESGKEHRQREFILEPVERRANVFDLAEAACVLAFAQPGAAEVEAQHGESEAIERFHGMKYDLVVQRAAVERVRMAHYRCMRRVWRTAIQQRFEEPGRAGQEKRANARVFREHGCKGNGSESLVASRWSLVFFREEVGPRTTSD